MNETTSASSPSTRKIVAAIGALIILCCLGIVCYSTTLFYVVDKNISLIPTPTIDLACADSVCLNVCISRLPGFSVAPLLKHKAELDKKEGGYELAKYWVRQTDKQLQSMSTPGVPDYLKAYQDDIVLHNRIWNYLNQAFPFGNTIHLSYIDFYVDTNPERVSASVWESNGKWTLSINLIEFDTPQDTFEILTHEYGHLLTLNDTQVKAISIDYQGNMTRKDFDTRLAQCNGDFFTGDECTARGTYLNRFGERFWTGELYETWINAVFLVDKKSGLHDAALQKFYNSYSDQFVTEYAATNPDEDIAESWTEFILRPKPMGTSIANQKILFFYDFPELIQMRTQIMHGICQNAADHK